MPQTVHHGSSTPIGPTASGAFAGALTRRSPTSARHGRATIGLIKDLLGHDPVVELDAGTGVLTGQLHRAGLDITALESCAMDLGQLRRSLPAVTAIRAASGALPFSSASLSAVVAHPHGVDIAEVARVLHDDGTLILVELVTPGPDTAELAPPEQAPPERGTESPVEPVPRSELLSSEFTDPLERTFPATPGDTPGLETVITRHRRRSRVDAR